MSPNLRMMCISEAVCYFISSSFLWAFFVQNALHLERIKIETVVHRLSFPELINGFETFLLYRFIS